MRDDDFLMQRKFDGVRCIITCSNGKVSAQSRNGLSIRLVDELVDALTGFEGELDGELVGSVFHAFDCLSCGEDYWGRYLSIPDSKTPYFVTVGIFYGPSKIEAFQQAIAEKWEGVVFKRMSAPITEGKRHKDQYKFKFTKSASMLVADRNLSRSVRIECLGSTGRVFCGNVTIPQDEPMPSIGDIIEVEYLYAMPKTNALFQPVYKWQRTDIPVSDCIFSQLVFKSDA